MNIGSTGNRNDSLIFFAEYTIRIVNKKGGSENDHINNNSNVFNNDGTMLDYGLIYGIWMGHIHNS